jgi:hypothetical protein
VGPVFRKSGGAEEQSLEVTAGNSSITNFIGFSFNT